MATDGHRIHVEATPLADGFYCPKSLQPVECDRVFPDIMRVVTAIRSEQTKRTVAECKTMMHEGFELIEVATGVWLRKVYLLAALAGNVDFEIDHGGPRDTVKGVGAFGMFVIMPTLVYLSAVKPNAP